MILDMLPQLVCRCRYLTVPQCVDNPPVTFLARLPLCLFYALAESLKEHMQQISKSYQRG